MQQLTLLLCAFFLLSCNGEENRDNTSAVESDSSSIRSMPELQQQKPGYLIIEGQKEPVSLQLYQSPQGLPLPFYTYLPPNVQAETITSKEGEGVQFNFNQAKLTFFAFPEGVDKSEAQVRAIEALGTEAVQSCENNWSWQWSCFYATDMPERVAKVLLGENQGRYYYYLVDYPAEYGDGFTPRYKLILDEWHWKE